jgi:hypothetical protein
VQLRFGLIKIKGIIQIQEQVLLFKRSYLKFIDTYRDPSEDVEEAASTCQKNNKK